MPSSDEVADEVWTRPVEDSAGAEKSTGFAQGATLRNTESIAKSVNALPDNTADEVWTRPVDNYAGERTTTGAAIGTLLRNNEEFAAAIRELQGDVTALHNSQTRTIAKMAEAIEWLAGNRDRRDDANPDDDHDHHHRRRFGRDDNDSDQ